MATVKNKKQKLQCYSKRKGVHNQDDDELNCEGNNDDKETSSEVNCGDDSTSNDCHSNPVSGKYDNNDGGNIDDA